MQHAERILVYGVTGSGKTMLAERLSAVTGIPWHSVDDLTWEPGWIEVPPDEQRQRIEEVCAGQRWILDTAYTKWLEVPLARVELIVGLDFPRWLSLSRLIRRTTTRIIDRRPICNGNRESVRTAFSTQSVITWHFKSFSRKRARMRAWAEDPRAPTVLLFSRPRQLEQWLAGQIHDEQRGDTGGSPK
jgi:hypothetical protein